MTSPDANNFISQGGKTATSFAHGHHLNNGEVNADTAEDQDVTTDDEKQEYSSLVRELTRIDSRGEVQVVKHRNREDKQQAKLEANLQGEIGSQISTIQHAEASGAVAFVNNSIA